MAPGRARDDQKEQQWQRRIEQWQASGLSVREFCARHGLATANFYNWRRVLGRRGADEPAFVPVRVVADAVPTQSSALEVVLADGRTVRIAPGFDVATLRRLLAVLEGRPCWASPRPCASGWPWHRPTSARALMLSPSWSGN